MSEAATLKFKRLSSGAYVATANGVRFHILKAVDVFGLTARRTEDGRKIFPHGWRVVGWLGTKQKCVEAAERILTARHGLD